MTNETISAPRFIEVVTGQEKTQRRVFVNLQRINNIEVRVEKSGEETIVLHQAGDRLELQGPAGRELLQRLESSGYTQQSEIAKGVGSQHR